MLEAQPLHEAIFVQASDLRRTIPGNRSLSAYVFGEFLLSKSGSKLCAKLL